jgi:hypothetical protein
MPLPVRQNSNPTACPLLLEECLNSKWEHIAPQVRPFCSSATTVARLGRQHLGQSTSNAYPLHAKRLSFCDHLRHIEIVQLGNSASFVLARRKVLHWSSWPGVAKMDILVNSFSLRFCSFIVSRWAFLVGLNFATVPGVE